MEQPENEILGYGTHEGTAATQEDRLASLQAWFKIILEKHKPNVVAMEAVFFGRNTANAIRTAEGRGAMLASLGRKGSGTADKKMIQKHLEAQYGPLPGEDDGRDGVAVALAGWALAKGLNLKRDE